MYVYQTKFNLTGSVTDIDAAIEFLQLYDMSVYLKNDIDGLSEVNRESMDLYSSDIISIVWDLKGDDRGDITLKTRNKLSPRALDYISQWVQGQNSDGIGESFEQQSFAEIYDEDDYGYPDPDSYYMVSFDWHTNPYVFKLINKTNESVQNKQESVDFKRSAGLVGKRTPYAVRRLTSHSGRVYGLTEEKPNYRVTFYDGPQGNKEYNIDIYAKDSDEAFSKAYKQFMDTFGDAPRYKGYTDAMTSEIPVGPTEIGIEFYYIDHGRNDRKGIKYMSIKADSEKDAVDIYNKTYRGKKFYQPWPYKIDPDGNCTYSDVKSTYFI